jgi:hypothetical protein
MCINILKGVGALVLAIVICFIANVAVSMANGTPHTLNPEIAFAWVGTAPAMFYMATGFWRRVVASLLGSIVSIAARFAFGLGVGWLLSSGALTEAQALEFIFGPFPMMATIIQLTVAYLVARALMRRGVASRKSSLATA